MSKQFRAIVKGRVQLVMYRDFCQRKARALGIVGFAKNLSDGTVEVIARGEESLLIMYIEKLKKGSILSKVEGVDVVWQEPTFVGDDFLIAY